MIFNRLALLLVSYLDEEYTNNRAKQLLDVAARRPFPRPDRVYRFPIDQDHRQVMILSLILWHHQPPSLRGVLDLHRRQDLDDRGDWAGT